MNDQDLDELRKANSAFQDAALSHLLQPNSESPDGIGEATIRRALLTRSLNDDAIRDRIQENLAGT